ncbi:hypothetical protein G7066_09025 [Leucobacter coleopterorum]|uniref:Uncharacterized protein n=1 Tax=Leucobacter coleopterorum TaxID=2714933 RepID=A0ABX6JYM3_9MICO|nr:hypothetical protein [Leucobacter coleopterorum]QIM18713.1 hypothetical protein G7066_09025 [Leucobacter coleopterorum]
MRKQVARASRLLGGVLGVAIVVCGAGVVSTAAAIPGGAAEETRPLLLSNDGRQWSTAL